MSGAPKKRWKYWLRLTLSLGLSALFLYLAVASLGTCPSGADCIEGRCTVVSGVCSAERPCQSCVDWSNLPAQLRDVSLSSIIVFSVFFLLVHATRLVRWYYLLRPLGLKRFYPALHAGAIGLAAIIVIPLRLGEFVRPYLIARDTEVPLPAALGTAVVERVIDGLSVTLLLFVTLATVQTRADEPAVVWTAGIISAGIFGTVMAVLLFSWWQREATIRVLRRFGNVFSEGLTEKALGLLEGFLDGVASLRAGGDLYQFLSWTVLYWIINALSLVYLANAFGLELGWWEGFAVMSMLVIGIMVPGGPGHIGTFEFFLQTSLGLFVAVNEMPERVLAFVATLHVLQFLVQVLFGIPFWLVDGVTGRRARLRRLATAQEA
ncbi:MAG: lysylphosphatidylglycerol synthase transmembrane domain-containing protein, partial [Myxococcota bacterium]|nr:lysylphosphatidylglycerol synthase transmembrane domain-containing protein [Myxococcota bacterium]